MFVPVVHFTIQEDKDGENTLGQVQNPGLKSAFQILSHISVYLLVLYMCFYPAKGLAFITFYLNPKL